MLSDILDETVYKGHLGMEYMNIDEFDIGQNKTFGLQIYYLEENNPSEYCTLQRIYILNFYHICGQPITYIEKYRKISK